MTPMTRRAWNASLLIPILLMLLQAQTAMSQEAPVQLTIHLDPKAEPIAMTDDDLMALDQEAFVTSTLWTPAPQRFSGPSLHSILSMAGATPPFEITLVAANDYAVTIGPDLIDETYPIIANRIDGAAFSVREKGPLWVMYPFDHHKTFKREDVYAASVWQLTQIKLATPD